MPKRHLPLIASSSGDPPDEPVRSPWQWVGFGALAIFCAWVPLAALAGALAAKILDRAGDDWALGRAAVVANGLYLSAVALGALAGGYLVGRWGPRGVGPRHAALSATAATAVVAIAIALGRSSGPSLGIVVVAALAPAVAALGGHWGLRGVRARSDRPAGP